jgi:pimeloyl-ACP methyl ester carboxylesterase
LSYLDAGGDGPSLVALHGHWMEGVTYMPLAAALAPDWRVIALDQRGHGHSDHAPSYTRDDYLGDVAALFDHLRLSTAVLLGNSLGGVNAYQFAARHPDRVSALVVEDIGAVVADDMTLALDWAGTYPSREKLAERIGPRLIPYVEDAFRETREGWRLAFDPRDMVESQRQVNGDHWADWLATDCPALLLRGRQSQITAPEMLEQMAVRRPNTRLHSLDGGHVIHVDNPAGFNAATRAFLRELSAARR